MTNSFDSGVNLYVVQVVVCAKMAFRSANNAKKNSFRLPNRRYLCFQNGGSDSLIDNYFVSSVDSFQN